MRGHLTVLVTAAGFWLLPVAAAGSHPGHGPLVIHIGDFAYSKTSATIVQNDYIFWSWDGPDTNHSVTSDPSDPKQFDSDPGKSPGAVLHKLNDGFAVQFTKPGVYVFHCKVHSFMTGKITVQELPPGSRPGPTVKPKLTRVSARVAGKRIEVRFRLNEAVSMRAVLRGAHRFSKEVDFAGPPGANRKRLSFGSLRPGRYRLSLIAVDTSTGIATRPATRVLRVR
jgi:plastocyanin